MTTLSATMDPPLTVLMRAAVLLSAPEPDLPAIQRMIVSSVQCLDAVRTTLQGVEHIVQHRGLQPGLPAPVISLAAVRSLRNAGTEAAL